MSTLADTYGKWNDTVIKYAPYEKVDSTQDVSVTFNIGFRKEDLYKQEHPEIVPLYIPNDCEKT